MQGLAQQRVHDLARREVPALLDQGRGLSEGLDIGQQPQVLRVAQMSAHGGRGLGGLLLGRVLQCLGGRWIHRCVEGRDTGGQQLGGDLGVPGPGQRPGQLPPPHIELGGGVACEERGARLEQAAHRPRRHPRLVHRIGHLQSCLQVPQHRLRGQLAQHRDHQICPRGLVRGLRFPGVLALRPRGRRRRPIGGQGHVVVAWGDVLSTQGAGDLRLRGGGPAPDGEQCLFHGGEDPVLVLLGGGPVSELHLPLRPRPVRAGAVVHGLDVVDGDLAHLLPGHPGDGQHPPDGVQRGDRVQRLPAGQGLHQVPHRIGHPVGRLLQQRELGLVASVRFAQLHVPSVIGPTSAQPQRHVVPVEGH
ncbi:UNVERIFIED_CONTAM: hypothetical protein RF653_08815 [Kocuria sp. CPCC 205316]